MTLLTRYPRVPSPLRREKQTRIYVTAFGGFCHCAPHGDWMLEPV
jgi:hypothetical protein